MKILIICLFFLPMMSLASTPCTLTNAQKAWTDGDIELAYACAQELSGQDSDPVSLLLLSTHFAMGHYEAAIALFSRISANAPERAKAAPVVVQALLHLQQYRKAIEFATSENVGDTNSRAGLKILADNPPTYKLDHLATVAFKNDPMSATMPLFDAEIDGQVVTLGLDTGANFICMDPRLADKLGIKYTFIGNGNANDQSTKIWLGTASFKLGNLSIKNAPIYVLGSLQDSPVDGKALIGTSILENFLVTLDYPRQQMVLSPRDQQERAGHEVPFYIWGDHYMFAKGSIGPATNLNFFIDTGLLAFDGMNKQIAFYGSTQTFKDLGYSGLNQPIIPLNRALGLGDLRQTGHLALQTEHFPVMSLGGVKIHGLISHAFLSKYRWTMDFSRRVYYFSEVDNGSVHSKGQ